MNERDKQIVEHVNIHYSDITENFQLCNTFEKFIDPNNKNVLKALKMHVAQIGENLSHLSSESKQ